MELGLQEAARMLGVSAETVKRWARQGRIGVLQPSGSFQVGLAELRAWASAQGLRLQDDSAEATQPAGPRTTAQPLGAALRRGGIIHGLPGASTEEVLRELVAAAPLTTRADRAALLRQLHAREAMASTGLGAGVALPHPRSPSADFVAEPLILIATLTKPVDWRALDSRPVHTAILLLSPSPQEHLQVLSRIAFLLREQKFLSALELRAAAEEIHALAAKLAPPA